MHGASAPPRPAGPHTLLASMLFGCHKDRQTSPEACRSFLSSFPASRHPIGQTIIFTLRLDATLRVISTGMCGILEMMRGSSQSNHIILRRNGSTCVQNDARYFSLGITVQMYNNKKLLDSFLGFLCLGCNLIPAFWASPDTFHDALFHFRSTIQTRPVSFPRFVSQFSRLCLAVYSDDKLRNRKKNSPKSTPYKRNLVPGWKS